MYTDIYALSSVLHLAFPNNTEKSPSFLAELVLFHCLYNCYNTTWGTGRGPISPEWIGWRQAISGWRKSSSQTDWGGGPGRQSRPIWLPCIGWWGQRMGISGSILDLLSFLWWRGIGKLGGLGEIWVVWRWAWQAKWSCLGGSLELRRDEIRKTARLISSLHVAVSSPFPPRSKKTLYS